jgi:hypothetical protein
MAEQQPGDDRRSESWPAGEDTEQIPSTAPPAQPQLPPLPRLEQPARAEPVLPPVPYVPITQPVPTGFGFRPQVESSAILALVVAIAAWVVCPVLAAIAALMIAGGAKAKIDASGGALTGLGMVTAARWIAWLHLGILVLGILGLVFGVTLFGEVVQR